MSKHFRWWLLLFCCMFFTYGAFIISAYHPDSFAATDPGWQMQAVRSLVEDGDLNLQNQLHNNPEEALDQTSLGQRGEWYPLHELLLPVIATPFYFAFGIYGCLLFNFLITCLWMSSLYFLVIRFVSPPLACISVLLISLTPSFYEYSYSFSVDVFGAAFLCWAWLAITSRRFALSGFLFSCAVFGRLGSIVTFPAFLLYSFLVFRDSASDSEADNALMRNNIKQALRFCAGGIPIGICFFVTNWWMYGGPFEVSYGHWQKLVNGALQLTPQTGAFSFITGRKILQALFHPKYGLCITAPMMFLSLVFGFHDFYRQVRGESVMFILFAVSQILFITSYELGFPGVVGNRYLLATASLMIIPLAFALKKFTQEKT